MHKRTNSIFRNLGFGDEAISNIRKAASKAKIPFNRRMMSSLKKLGLPESALKQIKFLEDLSLDEEIEISNKELISFLVKKLRRSFDAFSNKEIKTVIVFADQNWTIYAEEYGKEIQHLHEICKPYFDEWCLKNLEVKFEFDGTSTWKIIAPKKSDLPDTF